MTSYRQIPICENYVSNKKYSDLMYGYLQLISYFDYISKMRYIFKNEISFTGIAKDLGIHRQTASTKFHFLEDEGLISLENDLYVLPPLAKEQAVLVSENAVKKICKENKDRLLTVMAYLTKWYKQYGKKKFFVNLEALKRYLGLSTKNTTYDNKLVVGYLEELRKIGLIEYDFCKTGTSFVQQYRVEKVFE